MVISENCCNFIVLKYKELQTIIAMITEDKVMSVSDKLLLRKRAIIETVNDELKNIAQVEHSRHRSFGNFVVNLLGGILHTATSQRNLPYEYRPLICQMTDSLLYSKVYSSNSRYKR